MKQNRFAITSTCALRCGFGSFNVQLAKACPKAALATKRSFSDSVAFGWVSARYAIVSRKRSGRIFVNTRWQHSKRHLLNLFLIALRTLSMISSAKFPVRTLPWRFEEPWFASWRLLRIQLNRCFAVTADHSVKASWPLQDSIGFTALCAENCTDLVSPLLPICNIQLPLVFVLQHFPRQIDQCGRFMAAARIRYGHGASNVDRRT